MSKPRNSYTITDVIMLTILLPIQVKLGYTKICKSNVIAHFWRGFLPLSTATQNTSNE